MKKLIAFLLALLLCLSLAACSSTPAATDEPSTPAEPSADTSADEPAETPDDGPADEPAAEHSAAALPLTTEAVTFTGWIGGEPVLASDKNERLDQSPAFRWLQEKTGVTIELTTNASATANEKFNLMLVSEDYTDFIYYNQSNYVGGMAKYIEDEIIVDLAPYMDQYAPNYQAIRSGDESVRKATMLDDGQVPGFYRVLTEPQYSWLGPLMRVDWLEEMGLESPKTMDEWETVLAAFRDREDCEIPYCFDASGADAVILSAFDLPDSSSNTRFFPVDGKLQYRYVTENFRDYLALANRWYTEGLISANFYGENYGWDTGELSSGRIGGARSMSTFIDVIKNMSDNTVHFGGVQAPTLEENGKRVAAIVGSCSERVEAVLASITTACKDVPLLMQYMDYLFSDEGHIFTTYGIENETYTVDEAGNCRYNDFVASSEYSVLNIMEYYGVYNVLPFHFDPFSQYQLASEDVISTLQTWDSNIDRENEIILPDMISLSAEEAEDYSHIMSDIDTLVAETIIRFITGEKPLSDFDSFVETLYSMDLQTAIDLYQGAYDRYMAR